ncbi:MAG TPA: PaaI family thioesterase, partial [Chloroflexota bacterium]|nr:PaaI family thioesterase [Chloroflexota bacterium]
IGIVHGGLLCTLLDFAAGAAVQTLLKAGESSSSIEIKASYLKPLRADSGRIEVHGHALRVGGWVAFAEAHARDQSGELVGHATTSLAVSRYST